MYRFIITVFLLLIALAQCNLIEGTKRNDVDTLQNDSLDKIVYNEYDWSYEGENGPRFWSKLNPAYTDCEGHLQSPIDIEGGFPDNELKALKLTDLESVACGIENDGRTIRLNCLNGSTFTYEKIKLRLRDIHFHCPSEHLIKGEDYDMEIHLEFSDDESKGIVAVFVKQGAKNFFLAKLIDNLPRQPGEVIKEKVNFNLTDILPVDPDYYLYPGSLSSPPCTPHITYFVYMTAVEVSYAQIEAIKSVMPTNNARPVQGLNGRLIREYYKRFEKNYRYN